ncbi:hypothetical protein [Kitasatospora sp. NBC_01302]|uniref:hypothetical protein n=1 Tax=Kitasatospora sp. NBC_01302 TaxID=2903575 RepID=UPI002E15D65C|nr:hypothetical protein OG294_36945 [Kitasatospora sp. NBC_01302]
MSGSALFAGAALGGAPVGAAGRVMAFLDYFAGVFTLLSLTAVVVCGLAATDRLVLTPRLRVAVQSVHRATAVAALGFLAVHIAVKVAEHHAAPQSAVLPFTGSTAVAVALGTVAADLLVLVAATGALRGRFAGSRHAWLWRVLHAGAYVCWPVALAHGLTAGRAAHAWVLWGYGLCAALIALALLVRALSWLGHRRTLSRHRHRSKAHRPGAPRPAPPTGRSAPPSAGGRPAAWRDPAPARAFGPLIGPLRGQVPQQPRHAAPPVPGPLGLARPGGGR